MYRRHQNQKSEAMSNESKPQELLCERCHEETPMYPDKESREDCCIYCVDCYWEMNAEYKRRRRQYWRENPEAFEAYRKHAAQVLGIEYIPIFHIQPAPSEPKPAESEPKPTTQPESK